jgi:hypothetical protein
VELVNPGGIRSVHLTLESLNRHLGLKAGAWLHEVRRLGALYHPKRCLCSAKTLHRPHRRLTAEDQHRMRLRIDAETELCSIGPNESLDSLGVREGARPGPCSAVLHHLRFD